MPNQAKSTKAAEAINRALNWAYEQAQANIPGMGSAIDLANSHLKSCHGDRERAIDDLIAWQVGKAGAAGFLSNLGGIITMPVAVPANLASVLFLQIRMIQAVAYLRGYDVNDEQVRTLSFVCLVGSGVTAFAEEISVNLGVKLSTHLVTKISQEMLIKINRAVGFRLLARAGSSGAINLTKAIPFVGGLAGGAFDALVTRGIAAVAKDRFGAVGAGPESVLAPLVPPQGQIGN